MGYGETLTAKSSDIEAARDRIGGFRDSLKGADERQMRGALLDLSDVVVKPEALRGTNAERMSKFFSAYSDTLGHVPASVLRSACRSWAGGSNRFFPTPGELLGECRRDETWRDDVATLKGLQRLCAAKPDVPRPEPTEAEEADLARRLEALRSRWKTEERAERDRQDADGKAALDWYKKPRDWANAPGRGR